MFKRIITSQRVVVTLLVVVASLAAAISLIAWRASANLTARRQEALSHRVLEVAARTAGEIARAEDNARAFLLSGDAQARDVLRQAQADADAHVTELARLTRLSPAQAERVRVLAGSVTAAAQRRDRLVAQRQSGAARPAALLADAERSPLPGQLATMLASVERSEAALLQRREARADLARWAVGVVAFILLVTAGALAVWAVVTVERQARVVVQSEQQLSSVLASMEEGVVLQDTDAAILVANASAERILGLTASQLAGKTSFDPGWRAIREDGSDLPGAEHIAPLALRTGEPASGVMGVERPDGTRVWIKVHAIPVRRDGERLPSSVVCTFADITAERVVAQALADSEARYRLIAETANEGIVHIAPDFSIAYANNRLGEMLGLPAGSLLGQNATSFVAPDDLEAVRSGFASRRQGHSARYDVRLQRHDGSTIWTTISSTPMHDANGAFAGALAMVTDISDRRALEAEARQGLKMEAMARMASAVAHDFNNLLTVIRSVAALRADVGAGAPKLHEDMDEILGAVDRGAALTAHLLAFCRAQPAEVRHVDLGALLGDAGATIGRLVPSFVRVSVEAERGLAALRVVADPMQVEQVLLNLASNAADAMPYGGELRIRAEPRTLEETLPSRYGAIAPGAYATLVVEDTGSGMTDHVLAHLCEPFFSTKPQGRGTGLGLATVYGIVQQAGGGLTVESALGQGTSITIYLPCANGTVSPPQSMPALSATPTSASRAGALPRASAAPSQPLAIPRATGGTLLVVDDEEGVRSIVARVLEARGFEVLVAGSGTEALEIMLREGDRIRALITDVKMPGMTGVELARQVAAGGIDLPVLFLSGQLDTPMPVSWPGQRPHRFLGKPFKNAELMRVLDQLFDVA
jgi:PAS domain S-box-containing protein